MTDSAPRAPRDLVFLDIETTGLDPERHELLEVAAIRVTHDLSRVVQGPLALRVRPARLEDADPAALDLVCYSEDEWVGACEPHVALEWLWPMLRGAVPAGHNVGFDLGFLARVAAPRALPCDYHRLDTASLAWLLTQSGEVDRVSLQPVCDALGIERIQAHRALDDVLACLELARRVRERWVGPAAPGDLDRGLALVTGPDAAIDPASHPRNLGGRGGDS